MCVLNIYFNLFFKRFFCESSKILNVYIYKDVSARINVFFFRFLCICIFNIVYVRYKKYSYSEVLGIKEFDLLYINLYLISLYYL